MVFYAITAIHLNTTEPNCDCAQLNITYTLSHKRNIYKEMTRISKCGNCFDFIFAISVHEVREYTKVTLTPNVIFQRVGLVSFQDNAEVFFNEF